MKLPHGGYEASIQLDAAIDYISPPVQIRGKNTD